MQTTTGATGATAATTRPAGRAGAPNHGHLAMVEMGRAHHARQHERKARGAAGPPEEEAGSPRDRAA